MASAAAMGASMQVALQYALEKIEALVSKEISLYRGLREDLKKLRKSFLMHQQLLFQAESQPVCDRTLQFWFEMFEDAVTEAENLLERIEFEHLHRKFEPNDLKGYLNRFHPKNFSSVVARRVKEINAKLEKIHEQTLLSLKQEQGTVNSASNRNINGLIAEQTETDSVADDNDEVIDRDDVDVKALVRKICNLPGDDDAHPKQVSVISIVGMGGIGKTTLARQLFNHTDIETEFGKNRFWVCTSDRNFGEKKILELMLQSQGKTIQQHQSREAIVVMLREMIQKERFFLVLDNMLDGCVSSWDDLKRTWNGIGAMKGNCILVTTREEEVTASIMSKPSDQILRLNELSEDLCWNIMRKRARRAEIELPEEVVDVGRKMAKKCCGIPLAASIIGGMLRNVESEEWQSILDEELPSLLEDPQSRLMQILRLSFNRLPSIWLRKCFAYCSVLGRNVEIQREQLIQLWMGEGLLQDNNPQSRKTEEEIGNDFFNKLLRRGLFQDAQRDEFGNVLHCRMHEFVHEVACSVSGSKTAKEDVDLISEQVRYLILLNRAEGELSCGSISSKEQILKTRTFFWGGLLSEKKTILNYVPYLRVLKLSSLNEKELPEDIGNLVIHLRYLDISQTEIIRLPNSICRLYFLETLIAKKQPPYSMTLHFPDKFKNLQNLRFLDYFTKESSAKMPLEIGQLTCLRKLPFFNIGEEKGRRIGELGTLKHLSGSLLIRKLELITDKGEASAANLGQKSKLVDLKLEWSNSHTTHPNKDDNAVLEGLRPHTYLRSLEIQNFLGDHLPSWIPGLQKLVKLEITSCENCQVMVVSLRDLPYLRYLKLDNMKKLREWVENAPVSASTVTNKPFRKLEELILMNCPQLTTAPGDFPSLKKLKMIRVKPGAEPGPRHLVGQNMLESDGSAIIITVSR